MNGQGETWEWYLVGGDEESFWAYEEARSKEVGFHPTPNLTIKRSKGYRTVTQIPGRGHALPVQESEERKIQGP